MWCSGTGGHYYSRPQTTPHHTSSVVISQSDHCRPQDEPGQRIPSEMSELQEDGGQGEGDEEEGGEARQVGERRDLTMTLLL